MPALHKIQSALLHDIYTGEHTSSVYLNKIRLSSPERLDIYYNNTLLNLTEILAGTYPVLQKIVGKRFFETISRNYIETYTQSTGNRHKYGAMLNKFLSSYQPVVKWPYLPDIAAIEWAYFQAEIADDALTIDFNDLTTLIPKQPNFVLSPHPGVYLVDQYFNALEIWQEHQKNEIGAITLQENPQTILIWRDQKNVVLLKEISTSLKKLLIFCKEGKSFSDAMSQVGCQLQGLEEFQKEFAYAVSFGVFKKKEN